MCNILNLSPKNFFLAIDIVDLYLARVQGEDVLDQNDLYLLGITSIHIAIKLEENFKIPLDTIRKELGKD